MTDHKGLKSQKKKSQFFQNELALLWWSHIFFYIESTMLNLCFKVKTAPIFFQNEFLLERSKN